MLLPGNDETQVANAHEIVKRWNMHEELVAALRQLAYAPLASVPRSVDRTTANWYCGYNEGIKHTRKRARAALARVEGRE